MTSQFNDVIIKSSCYIASCKVGILAIELRVLSLWSSITTIKALRWVEREGFVKMVCFEFRVE